MNIRRWTRAFVIILMGVNALATVGLLLSLILRGPEALRLGLPLLVVSLSLGLAYWLPEIQKLFRRTD